MDETKIDPKIEMTSLIINENEFENNIEIKLKNINNNKISIDSNNDSENNHKLNLYLPMIALSFGMISHSICFTTPLPYVAYMILDFKMSKDLDSSGYAAGWIMGIFMLGRFFSGIAWGLAADKYGRRFCILLSLFNIGFFMLIFGFSWNFEMALVIRFCLGLGNGFMGICKTSISEISTNKIYEMRAFGIINGMWGLGIYLSYLSNYLSI
jgi:MFS family permease